MTYGAWLQSKLDETEGIHQWRQISICKYVDIDVDEDKYWVLPEYCNSRFFELFELAARDSGYTVTVDSKDHLVK